MARYIDADKLTAEQTFFAKDDEGFDMAVVLVSDIKRAPTADVVEVVRCRHCKYCSDDTPDGWHWCSEHERGFLEDDDFCSFGVREGGDSDG